MTGQPTFIALGTYANKHGRVAGVNIAGMQVSRQAPGGEALVALSVDTAIPTETLTDIQVAIDAASVRAVNLV